MKLNSGWVKLHRGLLDWEWYGDMPVCRLFLHLLITANYEDSNYKGHKIKRGQVVIGRNALSEQTGLSPQQVRTALIKLKSTNEVTTTSTSKFSVLTLVNYAIYQSKEIPSTSKSPANQPAINHILRSKEVKKEALEVNCEETKRKLIFRKAKSYFNGLDYDNAWGKFTWVCEQNNQVRTEERWTKYINK